MLIVIGLLVIIIIAILGMTCCAMRLRKMHAEKQKSEVVLELPPIDEAQHLENPGFESPVNSMSKENSQSLGDGRTSLRKKTGNYLSDH